MLRNPPEILSKAKRETGGRRQERGNTHFLKIQINTLSWLNTESMSHVKKNVVHWLL